MNNFIKTLSWVFLSSLVICLLSCGTAIKLLAGIPKLQVYSQKEIERNISQLPKESNVINAQLVNGLNSTEIKNFIYMSIPYRTYIYNKNNSLLCFNGETFCSITQLDSLSKSSIKDSYVLCDSENKDSEIDEYLGNFNDIMDKVKFNDKINLNSFENKVIVFMNTDIAKDQINNDWDYIYNSLNDKNPNSIFIRIWTDLNEEWGLKRGAKAKFKVRKVKDSKKEYYMTLHKLPYKSA